MKAVVYHGDEDMRVENVADPTIEQEADVLVRVERTAICGSDLHLWHHGSAAFPQAGFTVGHECLGTVEETGSAVHTVKKGDRVLVSCTLGCGHCAACKRGNFAGCLTTTEGLTHGNVMGFGDYAGCQSEAVRVPFADTNTTLLPGDLDDEACLFLSDILPTGYMGAEFAEVGPGDTVVVFGCGPVGTFAQLSAQMRGAARVFAVDLDDERLAHAEQRGCTGINPDKVDLTTTILEATHGEGADAVIEAVGVPALIQKAAELVRPGGRIAVIGVVLAPVELPWMHLFNKNVTIRTGLVSPQLYIPKLLPLIREGRLDPSQIISHRFGLDQARHGYEIFANHAEGALKVVLQP